MQRWIRASEPGFAPLSRGVWSLPALVFFASEPDVDTSADGSPVHVTGSVLVMSDVLVVHPPRFAATPPSFVGSPTTIGNNAGMAERFV